MYLTHCFLIKHAQGYLIQVFICISESDVEKNKGDKWKKISEI